MDVLLYLITQIIHGDDVRSLYAAIDPVRPGLPISNTLWGQNFKLGQILGPTLKFTEKNICLDNAVKFDIEPNNMNKGQEKRNTMQCISSYCILHMQNPISDKK